MKFTQDLRVLLLLYIGMSDLIFMIHLFIPILNKDGDLHNWATLLMEAVFFLPVAYYLGRYFNEKDQQRQNRERQTLNDDIEYKSRSVSVKLFELQHKFPNDITIHNFISILTDLKRISEIFSVAFPLDDKDKNLIENSYSYLNQGRADFQTRFAFGERVPTRRLKTIKENIDSSVKTLLLFGKRFDPNLDPA